MKKQMLYTLYKRVNSAPKLRRKLKIFATISLVGVVLTGTFAVWAGIAAFDYVVKTASSAVTNQRVENAAKKITGTRPLLLPGCLEKAKAMLSLTLWLERPLQQTFGEIKSACTEVKQEAPRIAILPAQRQMYTIDQKERANDTSHL